MPKLKFTPNDDRVLVLPTPLEKKTAAGIIIPDNVQQEKSQNGKVIAVGPGTPDKPVTVKVGDHVVYGKYSGVELVIDGTEYLIMKNVDIFGKIV